MSPAKASIGTGGLVGGLGLAAGDMAEPLLGLPGLLPIGGAEAITLAVLAASGAGERKEGQGLQHASRGQNQNLSGEGHATCLVLARLLLAWHAALAFILLTRYQIVA